MKGRKKRRPRKYFLWWKEDFIRLHQKSGGTDFDKLWDTVSTLNEGINSLVKNKLKPYRWFVVRRPCYSEINGVDYSTLNFVVSSMMIQVCGLRTKINREERLRWRRELYGSTITRLYRLHYRVYIIYAITYHIGKCIYFPKQIAVNLCIRIVCS